MRESDATIGPGIGVSRIDCKCGIIWINRILESSKGNKCLTPVIPGFSMQRIERESIFERIQCIIWSPQFKKNHSTDKPGIKNPRINGKSTIIGNKCFIRIAEFTIGITPVHPGRYVPGIDLKCLIKCINGFIIKPCLRKCDTLAG